MDRNEQIRQLFDSKRYKDILFILDEDALLNPIENDEQAELFMIAAFSYFNEQKFVNSISVGKKLINYLISKNETKIAIVLFESLAIIIIRSYYFTNNIYRAYFFSRRYLSESEITDDILKNIFIEVKSKMIENFIEKLYLYLALISVAFISIQRLTSALTKLQYIVGIVILSILLFVAVFNKKFLKTCLSRILK